MPKSSNDSTGEHKFEPGWLEEQIKKSKEVLDSLPPILRDLFVSPRPDRPHASNMSYQLVGPGKGPITRTWQVNDTLLVDLNARGQVVGIESLAGPLRFHDLFNIVRAIEIPHGHGTDIYKPYVDPKEGQ